MKSVQFRTTIVAVVVMTAAAWLGADQSRRSPQTEATVPMTIDLKTGTETYQSTGDGKCTHAPKASIYDVRAQLWTARHQAGSGRSVDLTFWRPLDGSSDMFSLAANTVRVSTVRGGQASGLGSGTVKFEQSGKGGTFRIDAKAADGKTIAGTIKCDAFMPHVAEGG